MEILITIGLIAALAISTYNFQAALKTKRDIKNIKIVLGGIITAFDKAKKEHERRGFDA